MTTDKAFPLENVSVSIKIGQMPVLWPHPAIYIANIDCIFYGDKEKTTHLQQNVTGFQGYGARLTPILNLLYGGSSNNLLLLNDSPDPAALEYFEKVLGLVMPETIVLGRYGCSTLPMNIPENPEIMSIIKNHPAGLIDGYVTDIQLEKLAIKLKKELTNSHEASRWANNKILLHRFIVKSELPTFDGSEVQPGEDLLKCLGNLRKLGYSQAAIRSSLGASGFGMFIADLEQLDKIQFPHFLFTDKTVLAQGWIKEGRKEIEKILSPSVQFFCDKDHKVTIFDITEQLLSRSFVHEGNISPPMNFSPYPGGKVYDELIRQSVQVAKWVASTGYKGTGSIDFLVFNMAGQLQVYVCEVNARVTGATYPSLLARHFMPGKAWLMRNFSFNSAMSVQNLIQKLDKNSRLFKPGRNYGILPINFIINDKKLVSKAQILFLADRPEFCMEMMMNFPQLMMPVRCVYDRD